MPVSSSTPRTRSRSPHRALTTAKDAPKMTSFDFEVTDMSGMPITLTITEDDLELREIDIGQKAPDISSGVTGDTLIRKLSEALHGTGRDIPVLLLSLHGTWADAGEEGVLSLHHGSREGVTAGDLMSGRLLFQYCVGNEKYNKWGRYDFRTEEDFCNRWFDFDVEKRKVFAYYRERDLQQRLEALTGLDLQQSSSAMVCVDADAPAKQVQDDRAPLVAEDDGDQVAEDDSDQDETSEGTEEREIRREAELNAVNRIYLWPIKVLLYQREYPYALINRVEKVADADGFYGLFEGRTDIAERPSAFTYLSEMPVADMFGSRPENPKGCEVLRNYIDRIFSSAVLTNDFMKYLFRDLPDVISKYDETRYEMISRKNRLLEDHHGASHPMHHQDFDDLCVDLMQLFFASYVTRFVIPKHALDAKKSLSPFNSSGVLSALWKSVEEEKAHYDQARSHRFVMNILRAKLDDVRSLLSEEEA